MKARFDKARWDTLSPLLDELLDLDARGRAERLAQLRHDDYAMADVLVQLMAQYTALERDGYLEGIAASRDHHVARRPDGRQLHDDRLLGEAA